MIDTHVRKYFNKIFVFGAYVFNKMHFTPNIITFIALIIGIFSAILFYYNYNIVSVILLWISGYFDAVDGELSRLTNNSSSFGTILDIVFDRIVEISIIISAALKFENARIYLIFLCSSIIISMTIFLTVGAISEKKGVKSFYYQAGLMERTEGFIMFSLMIILEKYINIITLIYSILISFTALQRFIEAKNIFKNN